MMCSAKLGNYLTYQNMLMRYTISELNRLFVLQMFIFLPESHIVHLIPHVCRLKDKNQYNTKLIVTKQTKEEETRVDL